jgi:hypothetical protein
MANWDRMLSPVREEQQNLFSLKFIGPSKRWNFKNRTESAESRASEIKWAFRRIMSALCREGVRSSNEKSLPLLGLIAHKVTRRICGFGQGGGGSVSQSPLKDQAFSTFLDQNPRFELPPENGISPPIFSWNPSWLIQILANPSISVGGGQQGWLAFALRRQRSHVRIVSGAPVRKVSETDIFRNSQRRGKVETCPSGLWKRAQWIGWKPCRPSWLWWRPAAFRLRLVK